ncbi:MAG: phosphatidate cytidylyltransferase [Rickettsiaceae bacterium]
MKKNLFRKSSNLRLRVISAIFIGFIFITAIFFIRALFFVIMLGVAGGMLVEWYNMTNKKSNYLYLGLLIIPIPIFCLLYISNIDDIGWLLLTFFTIIWSVDSMAMFIGKLIEGPKLAPKLSPKKTISGLLGGVAAAALLPILLNLIPSYNIANYTSTSQVILSCQFGFLGIVSQMSDLFISYFKRKFNIKDSGSIIPGHGGMLDRFDSIIFTAPIVAFYLNSQIG